MKTLSPSPDPTKEALRESIARDTAEYEARKGPVQTSPLSPLSNDGRRIENGRVQMDIVPRQKWKEHAV